MAILNLTKKTTVEALRKEFNDAFGAQIKLYNGNKKAEMSDTLGSLGLTAEGEFECRSSITVASFIERMAQEHGLKVKVYTCDEWVAVLDGLTLESAGKVKKNAVKADMESMIAYQRTESEGESEEKAAKEAFDAEAKAKAEAEAEAKAKAEAEKAKAKAAAEAAKAKAEAEKAKAEAERIAAESAAAAAAKAAAEKAKADAEKAKLDAEKAAAQKAKAEAEAAKAELERIKAEAAKAQEEAEKAKAAAAAAKVEAEKAAATPAPAATTASKGNKGALSGLFSVASNKKVRFSMGNLQFNPKKYEFRFALHQYDRIGNDNAKIASNYDGWIDLFGYGTSGYMGCEPTEVSREAKQYPSCNDIANTNYDWGVYNPISNGGNKEGLWRTVTKDEWNYLINLRVNATKLRAKACVNGINGGIFLPDDFYEHRVRVPFDSTPNDWSGNTYDLTQWATLEAAGAIFLPCCGSRIGMAMSEAPENRLSYWSSSGWNTYFAFTYGIDWYGYYDSYVGRAVRLVQDVK